MQDMVAKDIESAYDLFTRVHSDNPHQQTSRK
jgi:hypothetical protein